LSKLEEIEAGASALAGEEELKGIAATLFAAGEATVRSPLIIREVSERIVDRGHSHRLHSCYGSISGMSEESSSGD
jgi:hypothetical protein